MAEHSTEPPDGKHPAFVVRSRAPLNGGPPPELIARAEHTPAELFYVRNHGSLPSIDPASYRLTIGGLVERPLALTLADLRSQFSRVAVDATLQCAGNRRDELQAIRPIPGEVLWGAEAIMLSAGSNVDWLVEDLGVLGSAAESEAVAASVPSTDGVRYVPALLGLGTPDWDYGARGTLLGVTRGTTRAHLVRAVLEGIAERGADLVEAAEADTGLTIPSIRLDGGMGANAVFVQAVADATARPVEVAPITEATTLGAAFLAGSAIGTWAGMDDIAELWRPARVVEPAAPADRDGWCRALDRARAWIPELSALDF